MGEPLAPNITAQPQTLLPQPAAQTDVDVLAAVLTQGPENLENLSRPVQLTGTLVGMLENGRIALRTAAGQIDLSLQSIQNFPLKTLNEMLAPYSGSTKTLSIILQPSANGIEAQILIPKAQETPKAAPAPDTSSPFQQTLKESHESFTKGSTLSLTKLPDNIDDAFLITRDNFQQMTPAAQPEKAVGKWLNLVQEKVATLSTALAGKVETEVARSILQADTKPSVELAETRQNRLPQQASARIEQVLSPETPWPDNLSPHEAKATIIGRTPSQHTIIESEGEHFFIKEKGNLPVGTRLVLSHEAQKTTDSYTLPLPPEIEWATMRQMVGAMQEADPQLAAHFVKNRLPSPTQYLTATSMFLLSAMQAGTLDEWLGPPVLATMEKAGKKAILDRAINEMTDILDTLSSDNRVGEWRSYPLPLHFGQTFEMLRLYVHDEYSQHNKDMKREKERKTRFLITINMTRLGAMQLDGLSKPKQLDIIIRSEKELPIALPNELKLHYLKTLDALGMTGSMNFQTGRQNWIQFEETGQTPTDRNV